MGISTPKAYARVPQTYPDRLWVVSRCLRTPWMNKRYSSDALADIVDALAHDLEYDDDTAPVPADTTPLTDDELYWSLSYRLLGRFPAGAAHDHVVAHALRQLAQRLRA